MTHRYIARVVLEAKTPLFMGSGESSLLKDALVQKDHNGFPMIAGTSLTGVMRHALKDDNEEGSIFGYQAGSGQDGGLGSKVKISAAYLVLDDGKIAEGLELFENQKKLLTHFENLPVRQHVRINHQGVADKEKNGLFDNEVVYKGCRFVFEIELRGDKADKESWDTLLNTLANPLFRLGQGTRNGYGKLCIHSCKAKEFDLNNNEDFEAYLNFNPSFNTKNDCLIECTDEVKSNKIASNLTHYELKLKPDDFFMFGAGYGDDEVDNIPLTESVVEYDNNKIEVSDDGVTLIPGASIKGALSHRTAFHFNKNAERFADNLLPLERSIFVGTNNEAVYSLFGEEGGKTNASRGKVIIDDIFLDNVNNNKIFNHVAIDRFTGGAMDGALFSEKVSYLDQKDGIIKINITVENTNVPNDVKTALEDALKDICKGLLPLGGMTTKGHGAFTGKLLKDKTQIFKYED